MQQGKFGLSDKNYNLIQLYMKDLLQVSSEKMC